MAHSLSFFKQYWPFVLLLSLILGTMSCSKDTVETDAELIPYFEVFAAEAAQRGITVDYEARRIEGLFQNITDGNVAGQCFRNIEKPRKVIIDIDYWDNATEAVREVLVFHELGHCFLERDHDDRKDGNNVCQSIMHSSPQVCDLDLNDMNREEYLDELFK